MLVAVHVFTALLAAAPALGAQDDVPLPPPPVAVQQPPRPAAPEAQAKPPRKIRFVSTLGADFGFTDLLEVKLTDGSTRSVTANQGVYGSVGVAVPYLGGRLETQATLGLKYTGVSASNGSASMLVFPIEVLELVNVAPLRLGAGFVYLPSPSMSGDGLLAEFDVDFESSFGLVLQGEWVLPLRGGAGRLTFGPRFIWQKLQVSGSGQVVDANAIGAVVGFSTL